MSNWSYRIVKHVIDVDGVPTEHYAIHEVYYGDDGKPTGMTVNPVTVVGDTREEIIDDLLKMSRDAQAMEVFTPPEEWKDKADG